MKRYVKGFTLLEIMAVLSISFSIFLTIQPVRSVLLKEETAKQINRDVSILFSAMGHYYNRHCSEISFPIVDFTALRRENLIGRSFDVPWGSAYSLTFVNKRTRKVYMHISSFFRSEKEAQYTAGFFKNAHVEGNRVVWTQRLLFRRDLQSIQQQRDKAIFDSSQC
jgi:prepilin-type N-terminal cleavage/methylation domain-containing protein